ncbi:prephenate dehydrogenase [Oceanobacillus sp. FSL H7-0719]|uniref:prephenate dehydrogenase n=1 Tax=Oceanobacillus sp. FSL H7-0719 TaxID=2954507 RepID=UPI003245DD74
MNKRRILIAGLGLIGGSLAKSIIKNENNYVLGYDVNPDSLQYGLAHGIINEAYEEFTEAAIQSDIIILAAPISETIKLMKQLDQLDFEKQVIVSDTASVKSSIIKTAEALTNDKIAFIGGHPMAGSHKRGIGAAKPHLFENAIYVLTPSVRSTDEMLETMKDILKYTKSKFIILRPEEHDEMTGVVSHFPHLIASSLVHQAKKWESTHTYLPKLAAGGFRDITRIASSNPEMWQDIFFHNREKMSVLLQEWIEEMIHLKELVDNNHKMTMIAYLQDAKNYRDGIPVKTSGAIPAFYDLYVDIRDQSGALASVVQLLADKNISIKNIEILEVREGITGVLRLSFYSKDAQKMSKTYLKENGFDAMIQK